ncbi:WD40 repeat-containing protein HOS15 [Trifolium repens]|nr:WD40 repeat-containing protein HOS15 [Trifolium repens]
MAPPSAFLTNATPSTSSSWFPDSGASFHVTGDSWNLQQLTPFEDHDQIYIGNGQGLPILSSGSSTFSSPSQPHLTLTLNNLLHISHITKNLISVSQFCKDNSVYFVFTSNECLVKSQATNATLLQGQVGFDGLYAFPSIRLHSAKPTLVPKSFSSNNSKSAAEFPSVNSLTVPNKPVCITQNSQYLWHLRVGHPHSNTLKLVLQQCKIPFHSNKDISNFCTACCMGKAYMLHSLPYHTQYNHPLELIFSDLWGPSPQSSTLGYNYYITFVDAYSRFTWIYLLKSKFDAFVVFKQFKAMAELQFGQPFKAIETDQGGEFRPFTKFLTDLGVMHKLICPHTHHQNGVVERKHRHIVELGLTLLSQASLPLFYWDYAFLTVVYLINILPSAPLNFKIPYTILFHQDPDYQFL